MADIKDNPIYQETWALMEAKKEKEIDKWKKTDQICVVRDRYITS